MYRTDMSPCRRLLYLLILIISISSVKQFTLSNKFNIIIRTPNKTSSSATEPYKSVHIKYILPKNVQQWIIVGFEPQIQIHQKIIEQLTVHLCDSYIDDSIWYDDTTICNSAQSMLIYEWTPYSSVSPFRLPDDCGFQLNKFRSIILTVIYKIEKRVHKEQSGIKLYISTQPPKCLVGAMSVGSKHSGTQFSCRSSDSTRLIYGIKKLNFQPNNSWWRIHIIFVRQLRRKLVQPLFDSRTLRNINESNIEIVSPDIFFMNGYYLLIECENKSQSNCYFLIYYIYKSNLIKHENICQTNEYPNSFKLIPSSQVPNINQRKKNTSSIDGSTILLIILIILLSIWVSTIIGCIIMRRIRGLVNFRTESPFALSSKNRYLGYGTRMQTDQRTTEADQVMQMDGEHGGFAGY